MKARLLKLFTVCLITAVLILPVLVVGRIWQYHSAFVHGDFVAAQSVVLPGDPCGNCEAARTPSTPLSSAQDKEFTLAESPILFKPSSAMTTAMTTFTAFSFLLSMPLGFCSGLWLNEQYRIHRNTVLKKQVAILERLWQESIY